MDPEKKKVVFTICCFAVIILAAVLLIKGGSLSEPPGLKVSNEYGIKISAQRGTYSWQTSRTSDVNADSAGPLRLYNLGELQGTEASENDDYSLMLEFGKDPDSVSVVIYPKSAAATEDYSSAIQRDVTTSRTGWRFTIPEDDVYIVEVYAKYEKGNCYYYFYTTP
ncbi:MAG: hypothetical protein IJM61_01680 [Firmicutes bacterium]|nr:hypothetical protein [Bacillota bacterium]